MIEKLRIAVVVKNLTTVWPKGTIVFSEDDDAEQFCDNIKLKGKTQFLEDEYLMSCVIDTRTAKGDDTLGAFLMMVYHYRYANLSGLGWPSEKVTADDAYQALERLYEHGTLDDSITIKINDADCTISRVSAQNMLITLARELS